MDKLITTFAETLGGYGLAGVMIGGLAYWVWRLQGRLDLVQERRVEEAMKNADAAHALAGALDRNTEVLRTLVGED